MHIALHALQSAVHERELADVVRALAESGVDALISKGWAAARLYAEPGLRPYGDIDVCVAPQAYRAAQAALAEWAPGVNVDLHAGLGTNQRVLADLPTFEEARERAAHEPLGDVEVPILSPEDHLALLCVHLLSHGVWRPLWLCDVAAAVEQLPEDFDWDRCFGRSRRLATWISATLTFAKRLLGARVSRPPPVRARSPRWLEPAVVKQWGSPRPDYPSDLIGMPDCCVLPATPGGTRRACPLGRSDQGDDVPGCGLQQPAAAAVPGALRRVEGWPLLPPSRGKGKSRFPCSDSSPVISTRRAVASPYLNETATRRVSPSSRNVDTASRPSSGAGRRLGLARCSAYAASGDNAWSL